MYFKKLQTILLKLFYQTGPNFHNSLLLAIGILGSGVVKSYVGFEFLSIANKFNLEIYLSRSTLFFRSLIKKKIKKKRNF